MTLNSESGKHALDLRVGAVNLVLASGRRGLISAAETRLGGFATDLERGNVWYVPPTLYSMMGGSLCAQAELILDGAVTSANIRSLGP